MFRYMVQQLEKLVTTESLNTLGKMLGEQLKSLFNLEIFV